MPAWRREFLARFPEHQTEAQSATYAGALLSRPLFFVLKDALNQGDTELISKVISYARWLDDTPRCNCHAELQEDLFGPITDSEALRAGLLRCLSREDFERMKKYFVLDWQPLASRLAKQRLVEREYNDLAVRRHHGG